MIESFDMTSKLTQQQNRWCLIFGSIIDDSTLKTENDITIE